MTVPLALQQICKAYGRTQILRGITLSLAAKERHAIIGPNGAGKSTLLDVISGRIAPTSGTVLLHGSPITNLPPHRIARAGLARSFQITNLFPALTVLEAMQAACLMPTGIGASPWRLLGRSSSVSKWADNVLGRVGLEGMAERKISEMAYADQRRLELGLALASDAALLVLDEPTAGLSRAEAEQMTALVRRETQDKTLIVVEHDMHVVFALADRITVLNQGRCLATGTPDEIRANAAVQEAYLGATSEHAPC